MRLTALAASTFAVCLMPLCAQSPGGDLREEIRRIVREEIRAALKEAHATTAKQAPTTSAFEIRGEGNASPHVMQVVPPEHAKGAPSPGVGPDIQIYMVDGEGKPIATQVHGTAKGTKAMKLDGGTTLFYDDGQDGKVKTLVLSPETTKHAFKIDTSEGAPAGHTFQFKVGAEGKKAEAPCCEEVTKAVAECCEALEKCCEACKACEGEKSEKSEKGEENEEGEQGEENEKGAVITLDDVTTGKQDKKAAKKEKKKAKKAKKAKQASGAI